MEVNPSGKQEFHWGDCSIDSGITKKFDKLRDYPSSTGCGYVSKDSLSLTSCPADKTMAFICEHPSGSDSCFTTMSAISKMGFDSKSTLTSSGCASSCLSDSSCAGIYVSKETMCTLLTYKSQMSWTLAASDLQSTHMFHRRLLYHSSYNSFQGGLTEDELCQIPVASPIVTTEIPGKVTTKEITPSPTLTSPDTKIDLNSVDAKSTSSMLNSENQLHSSSIPNPCISQTSIDNSNCQLTQNYTTTSEGSSSVTSQLTSKYSTSTEDISLLTSQLTTNHQTTTQDSPITSQNTALLTEDIFEVKPLHNSTICTCTCRKTNESLQEKLQKISKLKVKTYTLSSVIRTKVSADDTRLSARCFGAMGIAILSFFGGAVVCSDVIPFFKFLVRKK
ncbi:mucin-16-like [Saccostrea cucullata]|uniref:mucin-16-like n=1 Tax=Saccostrea cuccullata TaxID=36930 RepID=UPI002ED44F91